MRAAAIRHCLILMLAVLLHTQGAPLRASEPTWRAIPIGTDGTKHGFWEYLPSAYYDRPHDTFAAVFFFHGLGEGGNGNSELNRVLKNGPPMIINSSSHPLRRIFEENETLVFCPQVTANTWWNHVHIRRFLDWTLARYRIDPDRILFTGLSAGSSGIINFLNSDVKGAEEPAAYLICAVRGKIETAQGIDVASRHPFWGLTAVGDGSGTVTLSCNNVSSALAGTTLNCLANCPSSDVIRTGHYTPGSGWVWQNGIVGTPGSNPQYTRFPGSNHNSWTATYNSRAVWDWFLAQDKGGSGSQNQAPFVNAGTDAQTEVGQALVLAGQAWDDGLPAGQIALQWNKQSGPGSVVFGDASSATTTAAFSVAGEYVLRLMANDGELSSTDTLSVTVTAPALRPAETVANPEAGVNYQYYHGTWSLLPDFGALQAVKTGVSPAFSLDERQQDNSFGFVFEGYVNIPADGEYTFYTSSDDGSQLFIGSVLVVDNDGAHANRERSGAIGLQKGFHPIRVTFFERAGGQILNVSWSGPGLAKTAIPASALVHAGDVPPPPPAPAFALGINAGGGAYTAQDGTTYEADRYATGGTAITRSIGVANTTDDVLYNSYRYGNFSYAIPVANGAYQVLLQFSEIVPNPAVGSRVFDVKAEGMLVLDNMDIFKEAGQYAALDRMISCSVTDGRLDIQFISVAGNAKVDAIRIVRVD